MKIMDNLTMYETIKCRNMKILERTPRSEITKFPHDFIATHRRAFLLSSITCSNDSQVGYIQC